MQPNLTSSFTTRLPHTFVADGLTELYPQLLGRLIQEGGSVAPRGVATKELIGASFTLLNPRRNVLLAPARKLSYHFLVAEWLFILLGHNDVNLIEAYNKRMPTFSDDGQTLSGAYGPKIQVQLPYILQTLRDDPCSRQAVMSIWTPIPRASKDIPCTLTLQYFIRNGQLHAITTMRSNDVWWGVPYDVFVFTQLQQYIAMRLGVDVGQYHHHAGSLHMYERDIEAADRVFEEHYHKYPTLDTRLEESPYMTQMPGMFPGLFHTISAIGPTHRANMAAYIDLMQVQNFPSPWGGYLSLLAHKFHGDDERLDWRWRQLVESVR